MKQSSKQTAKERREYRAKQVRDALRKVKQQKRAKSASASSSESSERNTAEAAKASAGLAEALSRSVGGSGVRVRVWKKIVLAQLAVCPNFTFAAKMAGISRQSLLAYRNNHPEFEAQCQAALAQGAETLEMYCWQRATQGVKKPIYGRDAKGNPVKVGEVTEFSDRLAEVMLRAHMRDRYNPPQQTEISGPGGSALPLVAPTQVQIIIPDNGREQRAVTIGSSESEQCQLSDSDAQSSDPAA